MIGQVYEYSAKYTHEKTEEWERAHDEAVPAHLLEDDWEDFQCQIEECVDETRIESDTSYHGFGK